MRDCVEAGWGITQHTPLNLSVPCWTNCIYFSQVPDKPNRSLMTINCFHQNYRLGHILPKINSKQFQTLKIEKKPFYFACSNFRWHWLFLKHYEKDWPVTGIKLISVTKARIIQLGEWLNIGQRYLPEHCPANNKLFPYEERRYPAQWSCIFTNKIAEL